MAGRNRLLVDKRQKKATVIDKATPNDSNIKKKEHEKLKEKKKATFKRLKDKQEKIW